MILPSVRYAVRSALLGVQDDAPAPPPTPGPGENQYFTDFSEYTAGSQPSDWTRRLAANFEWIVEAGKGVDGTNALVSRQGGSDARNALSWNILDGLEGQENAEVLYRVQFAATTDAELLAMFRGQGTTTSSTQTLYRHGARPGNTLTAVTLEKYASGSYSSILYESDYPYQAGTWYKVRARVNGNQHFVKVWPHDLVEPDEWMVTATDSTKLTAGWIGLFKFRPTEAVVDFFSAGINGAAAFDPDPVAPPVDLNTTGLSVDQNFDSGDYV